MACCPLAIIRRSRPCRGALDSACRVTSSFNCSHSICLDPRIGSDGSQVFFHAANSSMILLHARMPAFPNRTKVDLWQRRLRHVHGHDASPIAASTGAARRYPSCAVVGNSGVLLNRFDGEHIDAASAIFRVNDGLTHGPFAAYAGSRTSFRIWGGRQWPHELIGWKEERKGIVLYCQPTPWIGRCWRLILRSDAPSWPRLNPLLWEEARANIQRASSQAGVLWRAGRFPSSGAIALWIALRLCEQVRAYGFGHAMHPWNCRDTPSSLNVTRTACGRYFPEHNHTTNLTAWLNFECGDQGRFHSYVEEATPYHNLAGEWAWIAAMWREGKLRGPPCRCAQNEGHKTGLRGKGKCAL